MTPGPNGKPEPRLISKEEFDEAAQRAAERLLAERLAEGDMRRPVLVDGVYWPVRIDPVSGLPAFGDPDGDFEKRVRRNLFATAVVQPRAADMAARRHVSLVELEAERARWTVVCGKAIVSHATNAGSMPPEFLAQAWETVLR
jgi:hypothetical protein